MGRGKQFIDSLGRTHSFASGFTWVYYAWFRDTVLLVSSYDKVPWKPRRMVHLSRMVHLYSFSIEKLSSPAFELTLNMVTYTYTCYSVSY